MEISKSKSFLIYFIVLVIVCLNILLLNEVTKGSDSFRTLEKNIMFK